jgi:hypothetical protein
MSTKEGNSLADPPEEAGLGGFPEAEGIEPRVLDEKGSDVIPEPAKTDHPTGEDQAAQNSEEESPA